MNKYDRIMEHVTLSEAARKRILNNAAREASHGNPVVPFPVFRRYIRPMTAAACLVLLLTCTVAVPQLISRNTPTETAGDEFGPVLGVFHVTEAASASELAETVGFAVETSEVLEDRASEISYLAYGKDLAEIRYQNADSDIRFRKSPGSEDNSGDYNEYPSVLTCTAAKRTVLLKGEGESFSLAIWEEDGYSYSLSVSPGVSQETLCEYIESFR